MPSIQILTGDALELLRKFPDKYFQCAVTSPPYYGLRDYGTAKWEGGDPNCSHNPQRPDGGDRANRSLPLGRGGMFRDVCGRCGAVRIDAQIGLEPTPETYVERLVAVFREVRRVLKDDGTLWLNLGDSYAANRSYQVHNTKGAKEHTYSGGAKIPVGLKPKDLIGIPWMAAFALRADGWYLRSEIIWAKPNPMPESVRDRPTKSHEQIFLLSKSPKYFYDYDAVLEPAAYDGRKDTRMKGSKKYKDNSHLANGNANSLSLKGHERWPNRMKTGASGEPHSGYSNPDGSLRVQIKNGLPMRNRRDVWTVTTKPYKGAHFATFPPDLIEPCILAGSREGDVVLDPFCGSGTTLAVAVRYNRNAVGFELNPEYVNLAEARVGKEQK